MARIPVNVRDLPRYLTHDPIFFSDNRGIGACLHCGAPVDQRTSKERCFRREDYVNWTGNPSRLDRTH